MRLLATMPEAAATQLREAMAEIAAQSLRAGEIIRHLREYVMRGVSEVGPEDIRTLIEEAGTMALIGSREGGVKASFDFGDGAMVVMADRVQIQQVLINLMRNAIEAMRDGARRELMVRASRLGPDVVVEVADTGPGIAEDIAQRLFKPFVTSKATGMGIGLSISKRIVEAHGGTIAAFRNENGGATFRFTLPSHKEVSADVDR
jgi:two-component system sensor kinase FixL